MANASTMKTTIVTVSTAFFVDDKNLFLRILENVLGELQAIAGQ